MTSIRKKQLIAGLLLISSVLLIILLAASAGSDRPALRDIAEVDTLIYRELSSFNISGDQISSSSVLVDSQFTRVVHNVRVPRSISKTFVHAELHQILNDYGISDPATVSFPEKNLSIHLMMNNTVFRTIHLKTDTSLTYQKFPTSVFFYSAESPNKELVQSVRDFGEFFPLMLKTASTEDAEDWYEQVYKITNPNYVWLFDENKTKAKMLSDIYWLKERLPKIAGIHSEVQIMLEQPAAGTELPSSVIALIESYNIKFIPSAQLLDMGSDLSVYERERILEQFEIQAENNLHPVLAIALTEKNIIWMNQHLQEFKKSGISFHPLPL